MTGRIIVLGFPRSGTGSMAKILEVGHEKMNENGTSDWHIVFDYKRKEGDEVTHVIRNPIDVISSNFFTMNTSSLDFIKYKANIDDKSIISTIIEGFNKWTEQIEEIKPDKIVLIEDMETRVNTRPHSTLKWEDLKYVPIDSINKLKEIAIEYGYETND